MIRDERTHNLTLDKPYRLANDCVMNIVKHVDYNPVPPPLEGDFLLLDNTPMLLLDGTHLTLL